MKIRPLADRVMIKRRDADDRTPGGLHIPEVAREKQVMQAEVIAVGPGRLNDRGELVPMSCEPGQRVIVGRYAGTDMQLDGEKFQILQDDDVLAVIEP